MTIEYVDILEPPTFERTGAVKPVKQAIEDGEWLSAMNLWIVRPEGALIYQERPLNGWQPGKLDGSVGGYCQAGETELAGLIRETKEELGWDLPPENVQLLGKHLSVGVDTNGLKRHLVVSAYMTYDDRPLSTYKLDPTEVPAVFEIPTKEVITVFSKDDYAFEARGLDFQGCTIERHVSAKDFSYIFGGYHLKIAHIASDFARGRHPIYY